MKRMRTWMGWGRVSEDGDLVEWAGRKDGLPEYPFERIAQIEIREVQPKRRQRKSADASINAQRARARRILP